MNNKKFEGKRYVGRCPECRSDLVLRKGPHGHFYGCEKYPKCKGTGQAHPQSGDLLGKPGTKKTKEWRIKCHEKFDQLWQNEAYGYTRPQAYELLQTIMNMPKEKAHIGRFTIGQCKWLLKQLKKYGIN